MAVRVVAGTVPIEPASLAQVVASSAGATYLVPDDVGNVARDLRALDPTLRVRYSERGAHFIVYQHIEEPDGRVTEHYVTTAQRLDQRVVRRVEQLVHPSYDAGAEVVAAHGRVLERRRTAFRDELEGHADRLAHALRRDVGVKDRIAVP